jgi:hypothetical protein
VISKSGRRSEIEDLYNLNPNGIMHSIVQEEYQFQRKMEISALLEELKNK